MFGVLPPISKLTPEQAMYHFISGYTAKVAGTERGVKEPQATFSPCFGSPFLPLNPAVYAKLLGEKRDVKVWLTWLCHFANGEVEGIETPVGSIPKYDDLKSLFSSTHTMVTVASVTVNESETASAKYEP